MSRTADIPRCGACHFGKFMPQDFSRRICYGAPPVASPVTLANGQQSLRMMRPIVSVSDEACALYRVKNMADMERETAAMKPPPAQSGLFAGTKQ